ncbi:MAG TPA: hypothetical protein VMF69_24655 [Gemmataceae bacterium]|nr:hypothetical protein [Gemmataceae bacterium]
MPSLFLTSANKGKRIVFWTLFCIALSQPALSIYLDKRQLEMRDPLYGYRLHHLRQQLAESLHSPLFLIMGSSRVKYSVWPDAMNVHSAGDAPQPIVYNFGMNGMGTIRELMHLRRLLADGIRPQWLLLEVWPPLWAEDGFFRESRMVLGEDDLHWRDLLLLGRYFRNDRDVLRVALQKSLTPIRTYRDSLLALFMQSLLTSEKLREMQQRVGDCLPADRGGWFPLPWETTTAEGTRGAVLDGEDKIKPLLQPVCIDPRSDAALRELLTECRQRDIKVALILIPEPSWTRGWYTPHTHAVIRDYLTRLGQDYPVPIVDARAWVSDDDFSDSTHMRKKGVPAFSERLGREVVQPLIENRPLSNRVLFAGRAEGRPDVRSHAERGKEGF